MDFIKVMDFFGQGVFIERTDNPQVDADLRVLFLDSYIRKKPLIMARADVQRVLDWRKDK